MKALNMKLKLFVWGVGIDVYLAGKGKVYQAILQGTLNGEDGVIE